jgi:hypothetical protein
MPAADPSSVQADQAMWAAMKEAWRLFGVPDEPSVKRPYRRRGK